MSTFQERLNKERDELEEKFVKLGEFLQNDKYDKLPDTQRYLLTIQHNVMAMYLNVLDLRIADING